MEWSFRNLNLGGVEAQKASNGMKPGKYIVQIIEAKVQDTKDKRSKQVAIKFSDVAGSGDGYDYITVFTTKTEDNAKKAVEIGMERLKAILVYGGHPSPDQPGDIKSLEGLKVGVIMEQDDDWTDDNGQTRKGGVKPKRNGAYFAPAEFSSVNTTTQSSGGQQQRQQQAPAKRDELDDEIPF